MGKLPLLADQTSTRTTKKRDIDFVTTKTSEVFLDQREEEETKLTLEQPNNMKYKEKK